MAWLWSGPRVVLVVVVVVGAGGAATGVAPVTSTFPTSFARVAFSPPAPCLGGGGVFGDAAMSRAEDGNGFNNRSLLKWFLDASEPHLSPGLSLYRLLMPSNLSYLPPDGLTPPDP